MGIFSDLHNLNRDAQESALLNQIVSKIPVPLSETSDLAEILRSITEDTKNDEQGLSKIQDRVYHLVQALKSVLDIPREENVPNLERVNSDSEYLLQVSSAISQIIAECSNTSQEGYTDESFWLACRHFEICSALRLAPEPDDLRFNGRIEHLIRELQKPEIGANVLSNLRTRLTDPISVSLPQAERLLNDNKEELDVSKNPIHANSALTREGWNKFKEFLNHWALTLQMIAPAVLWELPLSLLSDLNPFSFTRSLNPGKKEPKLVTAGSVLMDINAEVPLFTLAFETPEPNGRVTRLDRIFHPVSISAKELERDRLPGEIDVTLPGKYAKHGVPVPIGYTIIGYKGEGTLLRSEYDTWKLDRQGIRSREICYRLKKSELHPPALINNPRLLETKERAFVHPATERALFFADEVQSNEEKIELLLEGLEVADATYTRDRTILGKIARSGKNALEWSDSLQLYICDNLSYSFCFTARDAKIPTAIINGLVINRDDNGSLSFIVSESHAKVAYLDETGAPIEIEPQDGLASSFPSHRNAMKGDWVDHFLRRRSSRARFFNLIDIGNRWRIGARESLREEASNAEPIQELETTQLDMHKARYTVRILSEIEKRLEKPEICSDIDSLLKILARIRYINADLIKQEFGVQGGKLSHERITIGEAQHAIMSEICEKINRMPDRERADAVRLVAREYFEERQGGNESESINLEPYWILTILNSSTQHRVRLSTKAYEDLIQSAGYNAPRRENPRISYLDQVEASDTFFTNLLKNQGVKKIGRRNTQLKSQAISAGIWMILRAPIEQDSRVEDRISVLIDNVFRRAQQLRESTREIEVDILETLFTSPFPIDEAAIEQRKWICGHLVRHARTSHLFDSEDSLSSEALTLFRERLYRDKLENKRLSKWNLFPVHLFSNMRRMGFDINPLIDTSDPHFDRYLKTFMQGTSSANQDTHPNVRLPRGMMIALLNDEFRFPLRRFFSLSSDSQSDTRFSAVKEQIRFGSALQSVAEEPSVSSLIHSLASSWGQEAEFFATALIMNIDQDSFRSHRGENGYAMFSFQSGGVSFALPSVSTVSSAGDGGDFIIGHDDSTQKAYMAIPAVYRDFFEGLFELKGIGSEMRRINLAQELTIHLSPQEMQMFPILWALMPSVPDTEERTHEEAESIACNYARFDQIVNRFLARKDIEVQEMCKAYLNLGFSDNGISTHSLVRTVYNKRELAIRTQSLWLPFSGQPQYRDPVLDVFFRFVSDIDLNNVLDLYEYSVNNAQPLDRQIRSLFYAPSNTRDGVQIRELREYQPGDALSHISWAASARAGRMISKVMESSDPASKKIVVDLDWLGQGATLGDPGRNLPDLLGFIHAASRQPEPTSLTVVYGGKIAYYLSNAELKQAIRSPGSLTMNLWKLAALANELKLFDDSPRLLFNADVKLHAQESLFVFASPRSSDATRKVYRHLSSAHASAYFLRS